jgi:hypothetical protein
MTVMQLEHRLLSNREAVRNWTSALTQDERVNIASDATRDVITRHAYIDGYWRIRRTSSMILRAIERLDHMGEDKAAKFWIEHLSEEALHDREMLEDLTRMFGDAKAVRAVLAATPISPPGAAMVGYFEWQVLNGNPHLLIALRLFQEWFFTQMEDVDVSHVNNLLDGGSTILRTHRELDGDHVKPCFGYIDQHCADVVSELDWSLDFTANCLRNSQVWAARKVMSTWQ